MTALLEDLRFGWRMLFKSPGVTTAAVVTLALGVGATSAVFSIVNAVLLRPLPYRHPERLVVMWGSDHQPVGSVAAPVASTLLRSKTTMRSDIPERWDALSRSFEQIAWYRGWSYSLTGSGEPERVRTGLVSAGFFDCLSVSPVMGRSFRASEATRGNDMLALLSGSLWRRQFGADPQILGKNIVLDGLPYTVIGIMPESFQAIVPYLFSSVDVWVPISRGFQDKRRWAGVTVLGRMKPGVALPRAQAEMDAICKRLEDEGRPFRGTGVSLVRLDREMASGVRGALGILFAAVGCILLIGCANLAGLMLARTIARRREIAMRMVLGAGRWRLVRQLITECVLIASIGGSLGLLLSIVVARGIVLLHPGGIPRLDQVSFDAGVFLFSFAVSVLAGMLFGLLPALQSSRGNVSDAIKESGPHGGRANGVLAPRNLLVVAEIGLATVLLIGAGLLLRSFALLKAVNPGFQPERLLTMTIPLPPALYRAGFQQAEFAERLLERVRSIPSVQSATVSNSLPMASNFGVSATIEIEGRRLSESQSTVALRAVTSGYLRTMGILLMQGREFREADEGRGDVVILNQTTARRLWPGDENLLGRQLSFEEGRRRAVIGVVADVKNSRLDSDTEAEIYVPFVEQPTVYIGLAVRTVGARGDAASAIRGVVRSIDPNQVVVNCSSMRGILDEGVALPRFNLVLIGSFSVLALVLAAVGTYGVVSYSATQRTHEIGLRMALGAERPQVVRMIVSHGAVLAAAGTALGLLASLVVTRVLGSFLFGITPHDTVTFAAVSAMLVAVCLAASYIPARRAARVDPMVALRHG